MYQFDCGLLVCPDNFNRFDTDKKGSLDIKQIQALFKSIAFPLTTEHIQETMDAMGITNGRFAFDELSAALDYYNL